MFSAGFYAAARHTGAHSAKTLVLRRTAQSASMRAHGIRAFSRRQKRQTRASPHRNASLGSLGVPLGVPLAVHLLDDKLILTPHPASCQTGCGGLYYSDGCWCSPARCSCGCSCALAACRCSRC